MFRSKTNVFVIKVSNDFCGLGSIERSASLQRKHLEEQDARHRQSDCYELSSDLKDKQLAVLRVISQTHNILFCYDIEKFSNLE